MKIPLLNWILLNHQSLFTWNRIGICFGSTSKFYRNYGLSWHFYCQIALDNTIHGEALFFSTVHFPQSVNNQFFEHRIWTIRHLLKALLLCFHSKKKAAMAIDCCVKLMETICYQFRLVSSGFEFKNGGFDIDKKERKTRNVWWHGIGIFIEPKPVQNARRTCRNSGSDSTNHFPSP